jgi:hypothetical protein
MLLLFFGIFFVGNSSCQAETVVLRWSPNADPDVVGYKVYYKANSNTLPYDGKDAAEGASPIDVANQTTATINGLATGHIYYFAVTAYTAAGQESLFSDIVAVPLTNPIGVALVGDINGDGVLSPQDALLAMQIAAGKKQATPDELLRGDIAPIYNGQPAPNGIIDMVDAIVILSLMIGTIVL